MDRQPLRLAALVELGLPPGNAAADAAVDAMLRNYVADACFTTPNRVNGLVRVCASVFGNPLGVACRLGHAADPRVARIAEILCDWQWPDGGWNCDEQAKGHRSSFHESLLTTWGLAEYHRATGEPRAADSVERGVELLLSSRLFRRRGGEVIDASFTDFHWPAYWHYDVLDALRVLGGIDGALADERTADAFDLLEAKRGTDGTWRANSRWWHAPGSDRSDLGPHPGDGPAVEAVDWGEVADQVITFNALGAGKLRVRPVTAV